VTSRAANRTEVRGAILLETLLAIALFAGAALFTIGTLRGALAATQRSAVRLRAADLARTSIAELEAGIGRANDLDRRDQPDPDELRAEVRTSPSSFEGLTLVEVTVRVPRDDGTDQTILTLRQLVRIPTEARSARQ